MKKGILVIALILGTITVFAAPKNSQELKGSGRVITQTKDAKTFNSIEVSNSINVVMGNSTDGRIVIKADDNVMPYVKTRFEGLNLVIKIESPYKSISNQNVEVALPYVKSLKNLKVRGAASFDLTAPIENYELDIDISGAGKVKLSNVNVTKMESDLSGASKLIVSNLSAKECEVDLSGASKASLSGLDSFKCDADISGASTLDIQGASAICNLDASGASTVNAGDFAVKNYNVDLSGASKAEINCIEMISGEISSASNLYYKGNPRISISVTSAARIEGKK